MTSLCDPIRQTPEIAFHAGTSGTCLGFVPRTRGWKEDVLMLNQIKSTFTVTTPRSEARALVEAFATQDKQRLYPFELQNFSLGVRFQNADPQTQRVIVMAMLAWLDQHSLQSYERQDQNAWQMGWKVREAFLHMLQFKIHFQEKDVIAMLNWSASQSGTSAAYIYFSGVPQVIKV